MIARAAAQLYELAVHSMSTTALLYLMGFLGDLRVPRSVDRGAPAAGTGDPIDERAIDGSLARFGGATFRRDDLLERIGRLIGLYAADPCFASTPVTRYVAHLMRRMAPGRPFRCLWVLVSGRAGIHNLVIPSHHFMSREDVETPLGRERLGCCVFHVPIGGQLVPMCEVNALGIRDRYYAEIAGASRS